MVMSARAVASRVPEPMEIWSEEPQLESVEHLRQLVLLLTCLERLWRDRQDYFAAGNLSIYFSQQELKQKRFVGPDFFVVRGVSGHPRASWVVWQEDGRYPDLIIELLSKTTADTDCTTKKELYEKTFRTPEYFWYHPHTQEFRGFQLLGGRYEEIPWEGEGRLWSGVLELYLGVHEERLRYFHPDGSLVLTPDEEADEQQRRAEQERLRADAADQRVVQEQLRALRERERAEALAAQLRKLGVDPDAVG